MKYSQYNSILHISEKHHIIYNSLSDRFLMIRGILEIPDNPISLKKENQAMYEMLQSIGGIIPDEIDEEEVVSSMINLIDSDQKSFILHINPTLDCNFHCWYCYENHIKQSKMKEETLNHILEFVQNTITNNSNLETFTLSFFGGEPLLSFVETVMPLTTFISELCEESNIQFRLSFTSNGYLIDTKIVDFTKNYNCHFQITLDGGKTQHDSTRFNKEGKGSYDKIIENILILIKNKIHVTLRVNYTKKNVRSIKDILKSIKDIEPEHREYLQIDLQRVWQDSDTLNPFDETYAIAKSYRKHFNKLGFKTLNNKTLDTVRHSCYGDKTNHLLINYNGDVYMCTARDFTKEERYGVLNSTGKLEFDSRKTQLRKTAKFSKDICKKCRIAPRCGGGCRTQAVEKYNENRCLYGYDDNIIDKIILEIFEERYL